MSYYIGLSILSNNHSSMSKGAEHKKLLQKETGRVLSLLEDKPFTEDDIKKEGQGRPFFPGRGVDFNISHSGNLAAVSFVKGENLRTGCDVELVRPRKYIKKIAEDFFSVSERDFIFDQMPFDETRFFMIWTLKECFLKLKGMSVFDMKEVPSFFCKDEAGGWQIAFETAVSSQINNNPLTFYLYEFSGFGERYILASAIQGGGDKPPEIRWFSQPSLNGKLSLDSISLDCKSIAKINY